MKDLILYMDHSGSLQLPPQISIFTEKGIHVFHLMEDVKPMLQIQKRLADMKGANEVDAKALDNIKISQMAAQKSFLADLREKKLDETEKIRAGFFAFKRKESLQGLASTTHLIRLQQSIKKDFDISKGLWARIEYEITIRHD
ncbi:hypothetical protein Tco_1036545 [Tanacetum coccineum]